MGFALMEPVKDYASSNTTAAAAVAANADKDREADKYFKSLPPGNRFNPFEWELLQCYLHPKINNLPLPINKIADVDIYKYYPWELAEKYESYGEGDHYFFTPRDKKYYNGSRPNRAARDGYWKATGADTAIKENNGTKRKLGSRKVLVYYKGKAPKGIKTNWIMKEYIIASEEPQPMPEKIEAVIETAGKKTRKRKSKAPATRTVPDVPRDMKLDDWVLCHIYYNRTKKDTDIHQNSSPSADQKNQNGHNSSSSGSNEIVVQDMDTADADAEEPPIEISNKKSKKSADNDQQLENCSSGATSYNENNGNVEQVRNFRHEDVLPHFQPQQQLTDPHYWQLESVPAVPGAMTDSRGNIGNWPFHHWENTLNPSLRHYHDNAPSLPAFQSTFEYQQSTVYSMMASSSDSDHHHHQQKDSVTDSKEANLMMAWTSGSDLHQQHQQQDPVTDSKEVSSMTAWPSSSDHHHHQQQDPVTDNKEGYSMTASTSSSDHHQQQQQNLVSDSKETDQIKQLEKAGDNDDKSFDVVLEELFRMEIGLPVINWQVHDNAKD